MIWTPELEKIQKKKAEACGWKRTWFSNVSQVGKNLIRNLFGGINPPKPLSMPYRYNPTRARPPSKISNPMTYHDG